MSRRNDALSITSPAREVMVISKQELTGLVEVMETKFLATVSVEPLECERIRKGGSKV
jgi:hypothetical protein